MTNPFDTSVVAQPPSQRQVGCQSHAFGIMGALVVVVSLVLGNLGAMLSHADYRNYLLNNLMHMMPGWLCGVLLGGLATTLLVRDQQERHGMVFINPGRMLLAVGAAIVLADLLYGALAGFLLGGLYRWLSENTEWLAIYQPLIFEPLSLLAFALTNLLPLWLSLALGAQRAAELAPVTRTEAASLLALGTLLLSLTAVDLSIKYFLQGYGAALPLALVCLAPLLNAALVFAGSWTALPAQLGRLRAGQLLLTALAIFIVWVLAQLLVAALLVLSAFSGSDALLQPLPLIIAGTAVLALLWPLTLLGLRWVYRAEAAA